MSKRLVSILASLALTISAFTVGVPVATAASYAACASGTNTFQSGEGNNPIGTANYAIYASIQVPDSSNFFSCTPNDNNGINASSVNIGIVYGSAFIETGIILCNHTDNAAWPASLCDAHRHFFVEQHGQAAWDYTMWDLGTGVTTSAYGIEINYNRSTSKYDVWIGGTLKKSIDMGLGLVPNQTGNSLYWQVETKDVNDGLGSVSAASNAGQLQYLDGASTWHYHAVGSACDKISSQHHCVVNGSYAFYGYTTN